MHIQHFDPDLFLRHYWQQQPLVVRGAFDKPDWITPEDLAGLACEADVESRIIQLRKKHRQRWKVRHGPFREKTFSKLPESHWTLLVQGVDQWVPEVHEIISAFHFLPRWRLDDIMVSYAPEGGTVSQHYDFFDVFLIQGEGQRRWQVGQVCDSRSELLPNTPVRILKTFEAKLDVTLTPGDMLYIPAKHAHLGVSVKDSLTYSMGFRAPGIRDIVDGVATAALETLGEDERYEDSATSLGVPRGEIPPATIQQIKAMLGKALLDEKLVADWFGRFSTERKYPDLDLIPGNCSRWIDRLQRGDLLLRNPASRFAYTRQPAGTLFVDGQSWSVTLPLAELMSDSDSLDAERLISLARNPVDRAVIEQLIRQGALVFGSEQNDAPILP